MRYDISIKKHLNSYYLNSFFLDETNESVYERTNSIITYSEFNYLCVKNNAFFNENISAMCFKTKAQADKVRNILKTNTFDIKELYPQFYVFEYIHDELFGVSYCSNRLSKMNWTATDIIYFFNKIVDKSTMTEVLKKINSENRYISFAKKSDAKTVVKKLNGFLMAKKILKGVTNEY